MDKKSCENCDKDCYDGFGNGKTPLTHCCDHWLRNPRMWLSILPEEPGWYWWREGKRSYPSIKFTYKMDNKIAVDDDYCDYDVQENRGGEFQGPIRPKGE